MRITISGTPGSGKSTIAKLLAEKLGYKHYSVGDFRRERAESLGMNLNEYNKLGEEKDFTDKEADEWQKKLGKEKDNFIIDGRLSYHFISKALKIFIDADEKERAKRIFNDKRSSEKYKTKEEALKEIQQRQKSDIKRYEKYYGINPFKKENHDLVIDTTGKNIEQTIKLAYTKIKKYL